MRTIAAAIMLLAAVSPAAAEDATVETMAVEEDTALARLVLEAKRAAQFEGMRFAFTIDFEQTNNKETAAFKASYDPRRDKDEQWALVGASVDDLDKQSRKAFDDLQKSEQGDDGVVYDKLGDNLEQETIDQLRLQSETEGTAVYALPLVGDDAPEGVLELVIYFDKQRDYVSRLDVRMVESYKPHPAVKLNQMVQSQYFSEPASEGAPALLMISENTTSGKAMFTRFTSNTQIVYSDIEIIE